ncbi:MAG: hypothetical protein ACRDGR_08730, partial [bacterium]
LAGAAALLLSVPQLAQAAGADTPRALATFGGCGDDRGALDLCFGDDEPGEFFFPHDVAVDGDGFVYVADTANSRIQKLDAFGVFVTEWEVADVRAILWGPDDRLYACDRTADRIWKYDADGNVVGGWGSPGSGEGQFSDPWGIAADHEGNVLVVDQGNCRIQKFTPDGTFLDAWGQLGLDPEGDFIQPNELVVLPDGTILVSDSWFGIRVFREDGTYLGKWVPQGDGDGQVHHSGGMALGPGGNVFVVDPLNHRIQVLTPEGRYLAQVARKGWGVGELYFPAGLAMHDGFLYVADLGNSAVQAYTWRAVVATDPLGLRVAIDGVEHVAPVTVDWEAGSEHLVEAITPQEDEAERWDFAAWSDGGAAAHVVTATGAPDVYLASFDLSWWLTMSADAGVTVTPASQWVSAGSPVTITAVPDDGVSTVYWHGYGPGSYTGGTPSVTITPEGPVLQHATRDQVEPGPPYTLGISASATDPDVHSSPPTGGQRNLYLWMICAPFGWSALEAQTVGTLDPLGFVNLNGVLNAGTADHLLLAVGGCPTGSELNLVLGYWIVQDDGGELCLEAPDTGVFGVVDCEVPLPNLTLDPKLTGFSSAGTDPCEVGEHGCPDPEPRPTHATPMADAALELLPPRPNPSWSGARVSYALPHAGPVRIDVFDVAGRRVACLQEGWREAGAHELTW